VFGTSACRFFSTRRFRSSTSVMCIYKYAPVVSEVVTSEIKRTMKRNKGKLERAIRTFAIKSSLHVCSLASWD
jgi:hypothetical protein